MDIFEHLAKIVQGRDVVIVEIGCYDGYHTDLMQKCCDQHARSQRIIAVEPYPRVLFFARKRQTRTDTQFVEAAICDFDGEVDLFVSSSGTSDPNAFLGSSSINQPQDEVLRRFPGLQFKETMKVRAVTLDSLMFQYDIGHIDFIWADVQGAEKRMIAGGTKAFGVTRFLYTEYSAGGFYEDDATLKDIMDALPGWRLIEKYESDALLCNFKER